MRRRGGVLLVVILLAGCERPPDARAQQTSAGIEATPRPVGLVQFPLGVSGARFVDAAGRPFAWRGVTAFRLAELIASDREREAVAYLEWARAEQISVVRVLLMARHLFSLSPDAGRRALPRLLDLAKERGIAVEAVAFADTKDAAVDFDAHVREIGRIAFEKQNAVIEIANEPGHPTQDARLHDPSFVQRLAAHVPEPVLVALGSAEYGERFSSGDYATFHFHRGDGWEHVLALAEGAQHVARLTKPAVSDEPIGAADTIEPGARDNDPARFAAVGALTAFTGMGATFHYEGGLHARVPARREAACFAAWQTGLALTGAMPAGSEFLDGAAVRAVARVRNVRRAFARAAKTEAMLLLVDARPSVSIEWAAGWREVRRQSVPGAMVVVGAKQP